MTTQPEWPQDFEQASALLREIVLADAPQWWLGLADRHRVAADGVRYDWAWVWAAETIASFHPERLLPFLAALRTLPVDRKQRALDSVGERLAVGLVEQPTLAECRAAIAEADEAPRRRSVFGKASASSDVEATLVAFVIDALGCEELSLSRESKQTGRELDRSLDAGPQHHAVSSRLQSATCTVEVERTETFYPGDVNEPARESTKISVRGTRNDGTKLTPIARVGEYDLWIDVEGAPEERDRIFATFWRTFGRPHRRPEEEYKFG